MDWLPRTPAGRSAASAAALLAAWFLLAEQGARVGPYVLPEFSPYWLAAGAILLPLLLPPSRAPLPMGKGMAFAVLVGLAGWPVAALRNAVLTPAGVEVEIERLSSVEATTRDSALWQTLQLESRLYLNRLAGARRNVRLAYDTDLFAPATGVYRFRLDCDDRCTLSINGATVADSGDGSLFEIPLNEGVHRLEFDYVQRGGPAHCLVAWDTPDWLELLPFPHYVSAGPSRLAGASLALAAGWWALLYLLMCRIGESRRTWAASLKHRWSILQAWIRPSQRARRRAALLLAGILTVLAVVTPFLLLQSTVTISSERGDWQSVTSGLQLVGSPPTLGAGERAFIHFHHLDGRRATLQLRVSPAVPEPIGLTAWCDGSTCERTTLHEELQSLDVPVKAGAHSIDVGLEIDSSNTEPGAKVLVHEIRLRRGRTFTLVMQLGIAALALAAGLLSYRRSSALGAAADMLLVSLLGAGLLITLMDPSSALAYRQPWPLAYRCATLALLWVRAAAPSIVWARATVAVAGTVGLLYLPSLRFGFITDDFLFGRALSARELLSTLYASWDPHGLANAHYRPVVALSLALDYAVWGARASGYHATNLVLHAANGLLAFALFLRIGTPRVAAIAGALAWCAHPVGAAAASWANERTDGIVALFYLATLFFLLAPDFKRRHGIASGVMAVLALGSKELATTLPVTGLLAVFLFADTRKLARYQAVGGLTFLVVLYVMFWAYLFPQKALGALDVAAGAPASGNLYEHPLVHLYPSVFTPGDYGFWQSVQFEGIPPWYLALGLVAWPLTCFAIWRRRSERARELALMGGLWPIVTALPLLALSGGVDLFRLGWLPALGFGWMWAALNGAFAAKNRTTFTLLTIGLAMWFAPASIASSRAWGPGGDMMNLGTRWKLSSPEWQMSLSPEMHALFHRQIEAQTHAEEWLKPTSAP